MTKTYQKTMLNDQKPKKQKIKRPKTKKLKNINDQNISKNHIK